MSFLETNKKNGGTKNPAILLYLVYDILIVVIWKK